MLLTRAPNSESVAFTLDIYGHMINSAERKAAEAVDEAMRLGANGLGD